MVFEGHVTSKNHYISTTRVSVATKPGRMATFLDGLLSIKSHVFLIKWSCEITWQTKTIVSSLQQRAFDYVALQSHVTNKNHYFFTTRLLKATKLVDLSRMMTYPKMLLPIESLDCLTPRSSYITWQTKSTASSILQSLWPLNLVECGLP